jgi:hypothetical protein
MHQGLARLTPRDSFQPPVMRELAPRHSRGQDCRIFWRSPKNALVPITTYTRSCPDCDDHGERSFRSGHARNVVEYPLPLVCITDCHQAWVLSVTR